MEPIAYLALEIKQRELDSRILIAAHLLKSGYAVMFGQQWAIFSNANTLPPGIVLFKTVNQIQAKAMAKFRASGHLVAATDEEVLVCTEDKCFLEVFSPNSANNCDLFFAQSELHKEVVERAFPALRGRTEVVGNARIDFLSPNRRKVFEPEVDAIREKYGPYILFNTNYGQLNSIWEGPAQVASIAAQAGLLNAEDPASVFEYRDKWNWEHRNRKEIVRLLQWTLDNIPDHNVVLRPHPGEIPKFWEERFGHFDRLHIIPRSNPHPWIMGSQLVIHTTCTTGLEAALMDKPVVNLVPVPHPTFDFVTNHINPTFPTWEKAAQAMKTFLEEGKGPIAEGSHVRKDILATHFAIAETEAAARIADSLVKMFEEHGVDKSDGYVPPFRGGGFKRANRSDLMRDKCSIENIEVSSRIQDALTGMGANIEVNMLDVDDSLFLLLPKPKL